MWRQEGKKGEENARRNARKRNKKIMRKKKSHKK